MLSSRYLGTMDFPSKLRRRLKDLRLSQQAIADRIGCSQTLVSSWANGRNVPDIHQGLALAKLLETTLDTLVNPDKSIPTQSEVLLFQIIDSIGVDESIRRLLIVPTREGLPTTPEIARPIRAREIPLRDRVDKDS